VTNQPFNIDERIEDMIDVTLGHAIALAATGKVSDAHGEHLKAETKQLIRDVLEYVKPNIDNLQYEDIEAIKSTTEKANFMVGYDYACKYFEAKVKECGL
jgi:hypothetical protein